MAITERMILERAREHISRELEEERAGMERLEGIKIRNVVSIRAQKAMYIAQIEQAIRNIDDELKRLPAEEGK